jgi:deoxyribonuclease V
LSPENAKYSKNQNDFWEGKTPYARYNASSLHEFGQQKLSRLRRATFYCRLWRTVGSTVTIAFVDVDYKGAGARAACVLTESWEAESPASTCVSDIETAEPYEPGNFYRRELPCIVSVLGMLPLLPEIVVVDGYVWLSSVDRPGLGARLYEALGRGTPVVGIAKTAFKGIESYTCVVRVLRGTSRNPLFVTAVGVEPDIAAQCVRRMAGKHRIPEILRITDRLCRTRESTGNNAA